MKKLRRKKKTVKKIRSRQADHRLRRRAAVYLIDSNGDRWAIRRTVLPDCPCLSRADPTPGRT